MPRSKRSQAQRNSLAKVTAERVAKFAKYGRNSNSDSSNQIVVTAPALPVYIKACLPSLVYKAEGDFEQYLLKLVQEDIFDHTVRPDVYVVYRMDYSLRDGSPCPGPDAVAGYFEPTKPCVIVGTKAVVNKLISDARKLGAQQFEVESEWVPLFAVADAGATTSLEVTRTLGLANEAIGPGMGEPLSSPATNRAHCDPTGARATLYAELGPQRKSHGPLNIPIPQAGMYGTLLRASTNPRDQVEDTALGPRTKVVGPRGIERKVYDQQTA